MDEDERAKLLGGRPERLEPLVAEIGAVNARGNLDPREPRIEHRAQLVRLVERHGPERAHALPDQPCERLIARPVGRSPAA